MISFILIGKNIQNTIEKSIVSVINFVEVNKILDHEIIYIDSNSNDKTLEFARKYPIKIILVTGKVNSAVARNAGAKIAKGDILFFLDGDMELLPGFFDFVFDSKKLKLIYPFINGYMKEYYYDQNFNLLYKSEENIANKPLYENVTGGLMLLEKSLWNSESGMDERLIRNQDLDFGLRMSKHGFPVLKDNHYWIIHHTTSYLEYDRFFYFLKSKALLAPGILMRKHFLNLTYLRQFKRDVFYALLLMFSVFMLTFNFLYGLILLFFYIIIQALRAIINTRNKKYLLRSFVYKLLYNVYSLVGFLFYHPSFPDYELKSIRE